MGSGGNNFLGLGNNMCEGFNLHHAHGTGVWYGWNTEWRAVTGNEAVQGGRAQIMQGFVGVHRGEDHLLPCPSCTFIGTCCPHREC